MIEHTSPTWIGINSGSNSFDYSDLLRNQNTANSVGNRTIATIATTFAEEKSK